MGALCLNFGSSVPHVMLVGIENSGKISKFIIQHRKNILVILKAKKVNYLKHEYTNNYYLWYFVVIN